MVDQQHYPKAPITEAIIDLRVELPEKMTIHDLEKVHLGYENTYPTRKNRNLASGRMELGQKVSATASSRQIGFLFISGDEKQVFQARLDGFTMSRLAPYGSWDPFRDEARRLWNTYRSIANPVKIVRLAVRYINRLDLPLPLRDFKDYLRTVPEVSPDLPQELAGYFMQLTIPQKDIKSMVLLNQTIIPPSRPDVVSVVLDIDIFRSEEPPSDEEHVWSFFEELHRRKNEVFEACLTDQARELFQ